MHAHAWLATELRTGPRGPRTHLTTLHSDAPLSLRPTIATGNEPGVGALSSAARVSLTAAAAGPVGGDEYRLDIHVGAGSVLVLDEISATLLLPGLDEAISHTLVYITVEAGATLIWHPQPVIAVRGCHHLNEVHAELDIDARLLIREEFLLGRHQEPSGQVHQHMSVRYANTTIYRQELDLGTSISHSPGVSGGYRAIGSILIVNPDRPDTDHVAIQLPGQAALMPLTGPAHLISALADNVIDLRHQLQAGLAALGPPWVLPSAPTRPPATTPGDHS